MMFAHFFSLSPVRLKIHGYKKRWEELTLPFKVSDEIFIVLGKANNFIVCHN